MKLIVGLGNPGKAYEGNRHNVGFHCVNKLAITYKLSFNRQQSKSRVAIGKIEDIDVILARPKTYMNNTGEAVRLLVHRFSVPIDDVLIIHDDMDLPLGKIRIRQQGSSGGHKGIKSIIDKLGSQDFPRIRVGIGRPDDELDEASLVLSNFTSSEKKIISDVVSRVSQAISCIITDGIIAAMNEYNRDMM